jgi:hypothetical protein
MNASSNYRCVSKTIPELLVPIIRRLKFPADLNAAADAIMAVLVPGDNPVSDVPLDSASQLDTCDDLRNVQLLFKQRNEMEQAWFREHLKRYLAMYLPTAGYGT